MPKENKSPWYVNGLHFECQQCGRCCSGPSEGYIWVTKPEIKLIADFLKIPVGQVRRNYLKHMGLRTTIIEQPNTKNCIFLREVDGKKRCMVYPVRPSQCRVWPFWPSNLTNPSTWNKAAQKCNGINRGRLYSFEEIEKIKKNKKWWTNNHLLKEVAEIYDWLDSQIENNRDLAGCCEVCGKCCDFSKFDHHLFVTTPELMYLAANLNSKNIRPTTSNRCPYNIEGKCSIYEHRFAGCRIFCCKGNTDFQNSLSESALEKFKSLCNELQIEYRYSELATALNSFEG
jgi:Fe-S-cluster containining protein